MVQIDMYAGFVRELKREGSKKEVRFLIVATVCNLRLFGSVPM